MVFSLTVQPLSRWRELLPEALAGASLAAGVVVMALKQPGPHRGLLGLMYLAVLTIVAVQDARTRRAPNRIVYPSLAFATGASFTLGSNDAAEALLGGALAFVVLLLVAMAGRGVFGLGDVKLGALCGIVVGLHGVVPMLALSFIGGGVVAGLLLALRVCGRKDSVPFTPFLASATGLSMFCFPLYLWS